MNDFKLSAVLHGHTADVKGVAETSSGIVTVSRDLTTRLWEVGSDGEFVTMAVFTGHSRYVLSVTALPATPQFPNGLIFTGSLDTMINVYDPKIEGGPLQQLAGHTNAVCSLSLAPSGALLSASWDHTAKVWAGDLTCVQTLKGHGASVLAVVAHPSDGSLVTCSGDKTIKLWTPAGACARTLQGHTDAVRALAVLDDQQFASCSNDTTIRLWTFAGEATLSFQAHDAFIYGLCVVPGCSGPGLASCGEDGSLKLWSAGALAQTIALPCTSVWTVVCRANGDLVVASDDCVARIFTRAPDRVAPSALLAQFDELAGAAAVARQGAMLGDVDRRTLPSAERLKQPGTRVGETIMVNSGAQVIAYSWIDGAWISQGVVTDAKDDFVTFQVEIDTLKLTLRHRKGDNPYMSAQTFLTENELGQHHLDEVAGFIAKNTTATTLTTGNLPVNPDPFTGGGAYTACVPPPMTAGVGPRVLDPFTGGGAYRAGAGVPPAAAAPRSTPPALFPLVSYVTFKSVSGQGLLKKVGEFNEGNAASVSQDELALLESLLSHVATPGAPINSRDVVAVVRKLVAWPQPQRFPALDLVRFSVLSADTAEWALATESHVLSPVASDFVGACLQLAGLSGFPAASGVEQGLACKCLANAFATRAGEAMMRTAAPAVVAAVLSADLATIDPKAISSLATVLLNYAVLMRATPALDLVDALGKVLHLFSDDSDTVYRLLMALGTTLKGKPAAIAAARTAGIVDALTDFYCLQQYAKQKDDINACLTEILATCT